MSAPINTYDSDVDLNLGQVPNVADSEVYRALLDIHNALEILSTYVDDSDAPLNEFVAKFRSVLSTSGDYNVAPAKGHIRVNAAIQDVTVTLPPVEGLLGYQYSIKRIDPAPTTKEVILVGSAGELVDGHASGVKISPLSSYTVKANATGWDII